MSLRLTAARLSLQLLMARVVEALPYLLAALVGAVFAALVLAAAWPFFKRWAKQRAALEIPIRWKEDLLAARREAAQHRVEEERLQARVLELEAALRTIRACMQALPSDTIPPPGG